MDTTAPSSGLTADQAAILDFERAWWKYSGAKDTAICDAFGLSSTQYYQRLNVIIDHPAALPHDPLLVRRLTRLRAARARQRSTVRLGVDV